MKVLHVNMTIDSEAGGGTAERVSQLAKRMSMAGDDCVVMTTSLGVTEEKRQQLAPARIVALPLLFMRFYFPAPRFDIIFKEVKRAQVVHLMGHWTIINVWVFLICAILAKPYVVCPAGALPIFGRSGFLKRIFNLLVGRKMIASASAHLAVTSSELPAFKQYGVDPSRVTVIPNGIASDTQDFSGILNPAADSKSQRPYILFLGRLNLIKGPDLLAKAFANISTEFKDFDLVFAGPDEGLKAQLQQILSPIKERIRFIGFVRGAEKELAFKEASFVVIPSRQEAMSIVVLEAGIQGTPVLMTDQCGLNQIKDHGGYLAEATAESLAEGLKHLMKMNANELKTLGAKLQNYVLANYSWQKIMTLHQDVFLKAISISANKSDDRE